MMPTKSRCQAGRLLTAQVNATGRDAGPLQRAAAQHEILDVLAWLWDTITEPVLTELALTTTPGDERPWPRVWWCPVGIAAYLPLHAAGHHEDPQDRDGGRRTVMDRVVSSYTLTLRALPLPGDDSTDTAAAPATLVVTIPDAQQPEPRLEPVAIVHLIPNARTLTDPTRGEVLNALPEYDLVHFDCHGFVDVDDPSRSHLVLVGGDSAPLTVADLGALELDSGLAFLSACQTAFTTPRLADESVHLTGAFHLAGYRHVIGTLWPVEYFSAAGLADQVYRYLTRDGTTSPDTGQAAFAIHQATRELRDCYPATPTLWAAHTHTGA